MECKLEIVQHDSNIPGRILMQHKPGYRCKSSLHWHSELEFVYMIHGCMEANINGESFTIRDGEFYFVNHEDIHTNAAPDKVAVQKYLVVQLSYEYMKQYCKELDQFVIDVNGNAEIKEEVAAYLKQLAGYEEENATYSNIKMHQIILELYYLFLTKCMKPKDNYLELSGQIRYAQTIITYIKQHYRERLTSQMLADVVGLSPQYLSKYFKSVTRMNLMQYLARVRAENANRELLSSDRTITEIALDNGFPNVKAYINKCKSIYGMTPVEYKKTHGYQKNIDNNGK